MKPIVSCLLSLICLANIIYCKELLLDFNNIPLIDDSKRNFITQEKMIFNAYIFGIYIGETIFDIEGEIDQSYTNILKGNWNIKTSEAISKLYNIDDKEVIYFDKRFMIPTKAERIVQEGKWNDHLLYEFNNNSRSILLKQQKFGNYTPVNLNSSNPVFNIFTLITYLRFIDYEKIVSNNITLKLDYIWGRDIRSIFINPTITNLKIKNKNENVILLKEKGGFESTVIIKNDLNRKLYSINLPAYSVVGWKVITIDVELKDYIN